MVSRASRVFVVFAVATVLSAQGETWRERLAEGRAALASFDHVRAVDALTKALTQAITYFL